MFSFRIYATTILGLFCSLEGRRTQSKGINFGYVCMWLADDNRMMAGWHAWVTVGDCGWMYNNNNTGIIRNKEFVST